MANYTVYSHSLKSDNHCYLDYDPSFELLNPFISVNPVLQQNPSLNSEGMMMEFSSDHHLLTHQTSQLHAKFLQNPPQVPVVSHGEAYSGTNKRKAEETAENSSLSSSPMSNNGIPQKNNSSRGKRAKNTEKKTGEKSEEVVHVRARRGQATDSHSVAERVRRGKINERLKCLQDIVPGCYKTMGMAVMLDEIINYVQSLQNQVEFLSMKLTAASQFYDFNSEIETVENIPSTKPQNSNGVQDLERIISSGGYDQGLANYFQPTWPC